MNFDISITDTFPDEVIPGVYVLGTGVVFRVAGQCLGSFVVDVEGNG